MPEYRIVVEAFGFSPLVVGILLASPVAINTSFVVLHPLAKKANSNGPPIMVIKQKQLMHPSFQAHSLTHSMGFALQQ